MNENTAKKGRDGKNDTERRVYYQMDYNGVSILIFISKTEFITKLQLYFIGLKNLELQFLKEQKSYNTV